MRHSSISTEKKSIPAMPVWLVLLYFQSVFKALADNVELSIRKMSSKSQQRETRASLKCKGSIQAELLQKDCVLQPQKFRSQFQCSPGSNLDFLSECFSLMINQSLPLPWKFFSVSGVKCLGTSSAMQFKGEKKKKKIQQHTGFVCLFLLTGSKFKFGMTHWFFYSLIFL